MNRAAYIAHRAYYAAAYNGGLRAVRLAVRLLPLHHAAELADVIAARAARIGDDPRYTVRYHYRRPRHRAGWTYTYAAVGEDRADVVTDAEGAARAVLADRARRALARSDYAVAVAEGRRWWRESSQ